MIELVIYTHMVELGIYTLGDDDVVDLLELMYIVALGEEFMVMTCILRHSLWT